MKERKYFPWRLALVFAVTAIIAPADKLQAQESPDPSQESTGPSVIVHRRPPSLTPATTDVLKMVEAGVDQGVIESFVQGYETPFSLSPAGRDYLTQRGVPPEVVNAMDRHDASLAEQSKPASQTSPDVNQAEPPSQPPSANANMPDESAPSAYVESPPPEVATFYDSLSPYGQWLYLPDKGWCWQPAVASVDSEWQPYVDGGRWCNTDDGWYWDSSYAWGWAPFHYGRWWNAPCGWVWFPDTVWAPSWVAWRYNDPYCGWAPLPPYPFPGFGLGFSHFGVDVGLGFDSFFFVGFNHFFDHDLRFHHFHPHNHEFFDHTVLAHDFRVHDHHVQNFGVPANHIAHVSGRAVPSVSISATLVDPTVVKPGIVRHGNEATVFRPALPTPTHTSGMVAQEIRGNSRPTPTFMHEAAGASTGGTMGSPNSSPHGAHASTPQSSAGNPVEIAPMPHRDPPATSTSTFRAPTSTMRAAPTPRAPTITRTPTPEALTGPPPAVFRNAPQTQQSVGSPPPAAFNTAPLSQPAWASTPAFHSVAPNPGPAFHSAGPGPGFHGGGGMHTSGGAAVGHGGGGAAAGMGGGGGGGHR